MNGRLEMTNYALLKKLFLKYLEYLIQSWIYRRNLKHLKILSKCLPSKKKEKKILKQENRKIKSKCKNAAGRIE